MLRRLHPDQPDSFAFTPQNQQWAEAQMTKYPAGRQASAIIPLLWRAQEQEGWLSQPAIEHVAEMLDLAYIRALEVATFYFMFQLQPVGSVAHIQICGTLSCMICGAEDLVAVCKDRIASSAHTLSADGKFSWEEVECLGSCANAPMAQIGKDYYEDLTAVSFGALLDELAAGRVPVPGPQNGRYAAEPLGGLTSLNDYEAGKPAHNASAALAVGLGDTVRRIDGTEVPFVAPWQQGAGPDRAPDGFDASGASIDTIPRAAPPAAPTAAPPAAQRPAPAPAPAATSQAKSKSGSTPSAPPAAAAVAKRAEKTVPNDAVPAKVAVADAAPVAESAPDRLDAPRGGTADDLKRISGVGPKLEGVLNEMGFWHFDQVAAWGAAEIAWVDSRLKFKGRIERDNWVAQATELAGN